MNLAEWSPLPWHEPLWRRVQAQRHGERLGHALLLAGPAGTGKRRFAAALAASLLCRRPDAEGLACGACKGCELLAAGTHPDWLCIGPEGASRTIRIDAVREVPEFIGRTAQQGGYKVVQLAPAEAMNRHAANALLKSLEEPAGDSLLLLLADHAALLPATLRSRCQRLPMPAPPLSQALDWLLPVAPDEAAARAALAEAGGRPLLAREWLHPEARSQRRERDAALLRLLNGDIDAVALARDWNDQPEEALQDWLILRLQSAVRCASGASPPGSELERAWLRWRADDLLAWLDQILQQRRARLAGMVPSRPLALEAMLLPACALRHT